MKDTFQLLLILRLVALIGEWLLLSLIHILIKLILFPLTVKQQKSSKLMAVMQPEMNAIQQKYKGKTDQQSMMMQQQEMKAVYEKYGTSMTGGCVQMLIQMPILFALYRVIINIPAYVPSVRVFFDNVVKMCIRDRSLSEALYIRFQSFPVPDRSEREGAYRRLPETVPR